MKLNTRLSSGARKAATLTINKKIALANTSQHISNGKERGTNYAVPLDPLKQRRGFNHSNAFNPDIRYRDAISHNPNAEIYYRNDLLLFAENREVRKAVKIIANEMVMENTDAAKYPIYPHINMTHIPSELSDVAQAMQQYMDDVWFPKLWHMYGWGDGGLLEMIETYLKVGKLAFEIVYDSVENPTEITKLLEIDPATLQKVLIGDAVYYIQKFHGGERVLHENQVVLIEHNKYDFGYISYIDGLKVSYNIMKSMMKSKIMWFAARSQIRMHVKFNMGDVDRDEAIQKAEESIEEFANDIELGDDGVIRYDNNPSTLGFKEYFTIESANSGSPEIEELTSASNDLSETDSLSYWERLYWKDTEIPYDRVDPTAADTWGFTDVTALKKIEVTFGKLINSFRRVFERLITQPTIIQFTLKEVEIGSDLSLLDNIKTRWVAVNEYEKLAELEILNKRVEIATNIAQFGEVEDRNGNTRKFMPLMWILENYLDFSNEQIVSMDEYRLKMEQWLGFRDSDGNIIDEDDEENVEDNKNFWRKKQTKALNNIAADSE